MILRDEYPYRRNYKLVSRRLVFDGSLQSCGSDARPAIRVGCDEAELVYPKFAAVTSAPALIAVRCLRKSCVTLLKRLNC